MEKHCWSFGAEVSENTSQEGRTDKTVGSFSKVGQSVRYSVGYLLSNFI